MDVFLLVYQHELDKDPNVHDEEDDYLDDNFAPDGIDTPSDDIYIIHSTNLNGTPHVKSLIHRTSLGKPKYNKALPLKLGIMDLFTFLSMLCLVMMSRKN